MANRKDQKEAKRAAVANRIKAMQENVDVLTGIFDERTLDMLILAFGIGHIELNDAG
jgi:hypothetical protein